MKQKHKSYDKRDFKALRNSGIPAFINEAKSARFDSDDAASIFFARELDYVKSQAYDVEYPEFTALKLFPVSSEADEGAETITYYTYDKTGLAKVISNYSTDLPRADVDGHPTTAQVKSLGASYGYSAQEMRASRYTGKSLEARKAEAAHYAIDNAINRIAWMGDAESGLLGVLSSEQNIPRYPIETVEDENPIFGLKAERTTWLEKTADEILDDINGMARTVASITKNVERPDTLIVPAEVYMHIATKRIDHTSTTVLDFLLEHSPYITTVESAAELERDSVFTNPYAKETREDTSVEDRGQGVALLYTKDRKKLTIENPMPFIQHPVQIKNLETIIPCEARTAGVIVYYPMSAMVAVGVC